MKAAVIESYGGEDLFKFKELPEPHPKKGEVKIKVRATGLNDFDWGMMQGRPFVLRIGAWSKPKYSVLGCDVAGEIVQIGEEVTQWAVGDRVAADLSNGKWGGFGQFTIAKVSSLASIPAEMSYVEAATLPHSGVLALQAVRQIGGLQAGKTLAVNGAGGGAGHILIKMAKSAGMHVTAIDRKDKFDFLRSLGADEVIDYSSENYFERKNAFDFIIDLQAHGRTPCYYQALRKKGKMSLVGGSSSTILGQLTIGTLLNLFGSKKLMILAHKPNGSDTQRLMEMSTEGVFSPLVDSVYPLSQIKEAMAHYRSGRQIGKVVVDIQ